MAKKISFGLSVKEVQNAIKEIREYKNDLNRKCEKLCRRLTAEGIAIAQAHIGSSGFGKYIHLGSEITPQQAGCRAVFFMEDTVADAGGREKYRGVAHAHVGVRSRIKS